MVKRIESPALYRVEHNWKETHDTFTLELSPCGSAARDTLPGNGLRPFEPGQFNMLYIFGKGEVPLSISGDPTGKGLLTHTTRGVGIISKAICALGAGDMVGIRGPFGRSWPMDQAREKDLVLVAGGIGLAPLRPVVLDFLAGLSGIRKLKVIYGTRSPQDILFAKDLKKWESQPDLEVYITVDKGSGHWRGNVGMAPGLIPQLPLNPATTVAMICGPEIMMPFAADALIQRGVDRKDIYLSMERNMKCAVGLCGRCQFGAHFICKDGPVFQYDRLTALLQIPEI